VAKHLRRGHPDEEILDFVADEGIDLIVMGTAGRSGFDRIRHAGSTTERVIRGATVSVLAVPPGEGK
jgi:nucleotide-binding universal stress UspA family protein